MSVLIDGIPMPKDCRDCCFKYESDASDRLAYCYISGCWIIPKDSKRAEVCLLKETQPEHKTGQWLPTICNSDGMHHEWCGFHCSLCNQATVIRYKFCPNCGAHMRIKKEGEQE